MYKEYLKKILSTKRYEHCVRTAEMAEKLCNRYNVDKKTVIAALLHDIAKEHSLEEMIELIGQENLKNIDIINKNILHGYAGSKLVERLFNLDDEVLSAIKWHTTGKKDMSIIDKIVYISDAIECGRNYENVDKLRELAFISLDDCILEEINYKIKNLIDRGLRISKFTIDFRNQLLENKNEG